MIGCQASRCCVQLSVKGSVPLEFHPWVSIDGIYIYIHIYSP